MKLETNRTLLLVIETLYDGVGIEVPLQAPIKGEFRAMMHELKKEIQQQEQEQMRHQILTQHKSEVISRAEKMKLIGILGEELLKHFTAKELKGMAKELSNNKDFDLLAHLGLVAKEKQPTKTLDELVTQLKQMAGKDTPAPAKPPRSPLAGNQAQLAESFGRANDDFSLTLVKAAARAKSRNGGTK